MKRALVLVKTSERQRGLGNALGGSVQAETCAPSAGACLVSYMDASVPLARQHHEPHMPPHCLCDIDNRHEAIYFLHRQKPETNATVHASRRGVHSFAAAKHKSAAAREAAREAAKVAPPQEPFAAETTRRAALRTTAAAIAFAALPAIAKRAPKSSSSGSRSRPTSRPSHNWPSRKSRSATG